MSRCLWRTPKGTSAAAQHSTKHASLPLCFIYVASKEIRESTTFGLRRGSQAFCTLKTEGFLRDIALRTVIATSETGFNRTIRHEWLDLYIFETIDEVQQIASEWLWSYNNERPNMGNGGMPPVQKLRMAA